MPHLLSEDEIEKFFGKCDRITPQKENPGRTYFFPVMIMTPTAVRQFFGHMKDEIHKERCDIIAKLKFKVDDYMDYYNNVKHPRFRISLFIYAAKLPKD